MRNLHQSLIGVACALFLVSAASSQVWLFEPFQNLHGWSGDFSLSSAVNGCVGNSARKHIWSGATNGELISPNVGTSLGNEITLNLGTAATQSVTQSVDTWYACDVTCGGVATTQSTPIQVTTADSPPTVWTFDTSAGDDCWSQVAGTDSNLTPRWGPPDGYGVGVGSWLFDFYFANAGADAQQVSPVFTPLAADTPLFFDLAGQSYSGFLAGTSDEVHVEESNDGGLTWNTIATMINEPGGLANSAGESTTPFIPSSDQWVTRVFRLSANTNRIRFRAVSDYGNSVYIDNVSIGVTPSARHSAFGSGCGNGPITLSSATAPVTPSTVTYDIEGAPELSANTGISAGVVIVDFTQVFPGTDMSPLLDADCRVYIQDLTLLLPAVGTLGATISTSFEIGGGARAGTTLQAQAAFLIPPTTTNALGTELSNGLEAIINSF